MIRIHWYNKMERQLPNFEGRAYQMIRFVYVAEARVLPAENSLGVTANYSSFDQLYMLRRFVDNTIIFGDPPDAAVCGKRRVQTSKGQNVFL